MRTGIIVTFAMLLGLVSGAQADPSFGPDYSTWKKCRQKEECTLVATPPPCGCGADSINKKFKKTYEQRAAEITRYWKDKKDLPACEPCWPGAATAVYESQCKEECYAVPAPRR
jgi:hypothetical protein